MKAAVFPRYGPIEVLEVREVPKPSPKSAEILIKVCYSTVIAGDCELRSFSFPWWFWLPLRLYTGLLRPSRVKIPGQEFSGEVETVGDEVDGFKSGDQVFGATGPPFSGNAAYVCVSKNRALALKPAALSHDVAATIPTGGLNALHYVRLAELKPGSRILINGACGNIGSFAVQLAKLFEAEVTAVDAQEKLDALRGMGADHVIDYKREDFTKSDKTYDAILDVVGKASFSGCLRRLTPKGRLVIANPNLSSILRGKWVSITSDKKVRVQFADYKVEDLEYLSGLIEKGDLRAIIDQTFELSQIQEAHRYVEEDHKKGNVVLRLPTS